MFETAIKTAAGLRPVTKREFALGALRKPTYRGDRNDVRYMDDGEIVSFDIIDQKSDFNWEFSVNGNSRQRIWFSQLNGVYLHYEGDGAYCCSIHLKDGQNVDIYAISPYDFWRVVKNRRFRVLASDDYYVIDKWHPKCTNRDYYDIFNEIITNLKNERYKDVEGMTKPMKIYKFFEE